MHYLSIVAVVRNEGWDLITPGEGWDGRGIDHEGKDK